MHKHHFIRLAKAIGAIDKSLAIEGVPFAARALVQETVLDQIALVCTEFGDGRFDYARFEDAVALANVSADGVVRREK
jgi:hypothetical protein